MVLTKSICTDIEVRFGMGVAASHPKHMLRAQTDH